jgi:hypothetical protein
MRTTATTRQGVTGYLRRDNLNRFSGYEARCPFCTCMVVALFKTPGFDDIAESRAGAVDRRLCEHAEPTVKRGRIPGSAEFTFTSPRSDEG